MAIQQPDPAERVVQIGGPSSEIRVVFTAVLEKTHQTQFRRCRHLLGLIQGANRATTKKKIPMPLSIPNTTKSSSFWLGSIPEDNSMKES